VADAPLGYWRLGESDPSQPVMDSSGNGNNGTYNGNVTVGLPGAIANDNATAAGFDGASSFVDIPSGGTFSLNNRFSLEAWVINAGQTLQQAGRIISNGGFGWGIMTGGGGRTRDAVRFTTFGHKDYDSNLTIVPEDGSWHYLAVTLDATNTATFYLDGVQTDSIPGPAPANSSGSDLQIGKNPITSAPEYFNGAIEEPAVYTSVLSPTQIGNHYNVGIARVGPSVVSTSLTGTVNAPVSDDIVTFSEPVDPGTFGTGQFSLTDPNGGTVHVNSVTPTDGTDTTFDVNFDSQSAIGTYAVTIGPGIADFSGNTMSAPYTTTFTITGNLVVNGGFETGDFTGWTTHPADMGSDFGVVNINAHSGSYSARFGSGVEDNYDSISQDLPTVPGTTYTVSFWLYNPTGGVSGFIASWGGTELLNLEDPDVFAYTPYTFTETATGSTTTLGFQAYEVPDYYYLDDVSVVANPPPAPYGGLSGHPSHGQEIAASGAQVGTLASPAAPTAPVAQGTTGWSHHASLQADQATLVDHILSAVDTKDDIGNLPSQPLSSNIPAHPVGLTRLWESPWLL
jgi:hypothetical protein